MAFQVFQCREEITAQDAATFSRNPVNYETSVYCLWYGTAQMQGAHELLASHLQVMRELPACHLRVALESHANYSRYH